MTVWPTKTAVEGAEKEIVCAVRLGELEPVPPHAANIADTAMTAAGAINEFRVCLISNFLCCNKNK